MGRRLGFPATGILALLICVAPLQLYLGSLRNYRLHSDDFPYLAASRTLDRTFDHLLVPHNTHIVPAWRLLTWMVSAASGRLSNLQPSLAVVTYGTLVLAMLALGLLVSRETGRASVGLGAMAVLGTSSLMRSAATWYSAGQALWAGIGILAALLLLQSWRLRGGPWRLALGCVAGVLAGWLWTVGYAGAAVGSVYLWADGRRHCRRAAVLPLAVGLLAAGLTLALAGRSIDARVSFHGRTSAEALDPIQGAAHTVQSISETLLLGNLGIETETTFGQAAVIAALIGVAWVWSRVRTGDAGPLEWAGGSLVLISYLIEWSFRGYLPFESLRGVVPWYDTIPQIGAVLFATGWISNAGRTLPARPIACPGRMEAVWLVLITIGMLALHQEQVDEILLARTPWIADEDAWEILPAEVRRRRALALAEEHATWQHEHLVRLEAAEEVASRAGIGRDAIRQAFGRLDVPELPEVYDATDLLDVDEEGQVHDPNQVRAALSGYVEVKPAPRPAS